MSGRLRQFVGGPLDGTDVPAQLARGHRFIIDPASHAAYMRTDDWRHLGLECSGCSAIVSAGDDGRTSACCPLCGWPVAPVAEAL